ncbi:MAG: replication factor C large subunit [archaeon]
MLWTEKYYPKKLDDVVGHYSAIEKLLEWWKNPRKPLLISGPVGVGKTCLIYAFANEYDLEVLEMNASDQRNASIIERYVGNAATTRSLFGKQKIILLDEIDGLYGNEDRGGIAALEDVIKKAKVPLIMTCNSIWDPKLKSLRKECEILELKRLHPASIVGLLKKIADKEKIDVEQEVLKKIAENSAGDVRAAVLDFQAIADGKKKVTLEDLKILSPREKTETMFSAMQIILNSFDFEKVTDLKNTLDEDPDFILKWVDENIPLQYKNPEDLFLAYEKLSKSDLFFSRVFNRQDYSLQNYAFDLMTLGVCFSKKERYKGFIKYSFPSTMLLLSQSKETREKRLSILSKISKKAHVSTNMAYQDFYIFKELLEKCAKFFGLTEEELEFIKNQ